ncbi:MAG: hypothetical protein J0L52_10730 [Caulobacterales bacterium]|nr:hypothetical protein [Caulobacterales bacterium]
MFKIDPFVAKVTILIAICIQMAGCFAEHPRIQNVDRIEYALSLPIERRIDLYEDIYNQGDHPRDSSLSVAFRDEGDAAFYAVIRRMISTHSFYSMIWIVKLIDQGGNINACISPYSDVLRERVAALEISQQNSSLITFRHCTLQAMVADTVR